MVMPWQRALLVLALAPGSQAAHDRTGGPPATYLTAGSGFTPRCFQDPYPQKCSTDDTGKETCISRIDSAPLPDSLRQLAALVDHSKPKKQVKVDGKEMPLTLAGQNDYFFSSMLVMLCYRAVVDEILGYNTTTFGQHCSDGTYCAPNSADGIYYAAVGCGILGNIDNFHYPQCDYNGAHIFFELWEMYSAIYNTIDREYMAQQPIRIGRHEAGVSEAWYVAKEWNAWGADRIARNESYKEPWPAYREMGIDLSYYKYLQDDKYYGKYFDKLDQVPVCPDNNPCGTGTKYMTPCAMQCGCWATNPRQLGYIGEYIKNTGDGCGWPKEGEGGLDDIGMGHIHSKCDGINDAFGDVVDLQGYPKHTNKTIRTWKCHDKGWWLGAGCRQNSSKCIAALTSGNGWGTPSLRYKIGGWGMPFAMGSSASFSAYLGFPKLYRILTYWWWPDPYLGEVGFRYEPVRFEPFDSKQYRFDGNMKTDTPPTAYIVGHHKFMESAPDDVLGVASKIDLVAPDFQWMISAFEDGSRFPNCGAGAWVYYNCIADLACAWMRENPDRVLGWIPDFTSCSSAAGQGLVDAAGDFVTCRVGDGCNAKQCNWCPAGRFAEVLIDVRGRTSICTECPAGKSQIRGNQQSCDDCDIGSFTSEPGRATCDACAEGTYQSLKGASQCTACPDGMTTGSTASYEKLQCICPREFYRPCRTSSGELRPGCYCDPSVYQPAQSNACLACPNIGISCGMGTDEINIPCHKDDAENKSKLPFPRTVEKYWASYEEPLSVYLCIGSSAKKSCPGGIPNSCGPGLKGIACGECEAGYYQQSGACYLCSDLESSVLFFLSPIPIVIALTFFLHKISQAPVSQWGAPVNGIGGIGYLTLVYVQTVGAILSIFPALPDSMQTMSFSGLSTEMTGLFHMECAGPQDYNTRFNMKLFIPEIVAVIMLFAWVLSLVVPGIRMDKNIVAGSLGGLLKTFFVTIATLCFSLFQKYNHPNGKQSMVSASHMVLNSEEWSALVSTSIVSILVNCIGYLAVISYAMYVAPRHFHKVAFRRRWKFMIMKMRPSLHWWMILVLMRALLLALTAVIFNSVVWQTIWIVISLILYFGASYALMPWRSVFVSAYDVLVHCGLLLMCLCMPFLFELEQDATKDVPGVLVFLCVISFTGFGVAVLYALYSSSPMGKRRKERMAEAYAAEITKIFPQIVEARITSQMMLDLPALDNSLVRTVAAMLDSELFGRASSFRLQWRSDEQGNIRMQPVTEKRAHPNWATQDWWA
eukprot:TRINITY_DN13150_c0_g1_i1.p1 TRINITY_DN13150_c0_g1~~TRINITY_DN13150_c0_g1_i1.p1  ORF type:complete len:1263 (-),score=135.11 TRINITY_DN13150_c0_g1_i1:157-3945(-)